MSDVFCKFTVANRTKEAISKSKVTEIYRMADVFCQVFDTQMAKYIIKPERMRQYHRDSTLSKAKVMILMILFHDSLASTCSVISLWTEYS